MDYHNIFQLLLPGYFLKMPHVFGYTQTKFYFLLIHLSSSVCVQHKQISIRIKPDHLAITVKVQIFSHLFYNH